MRRELVVGGGGISSGAGIGSGAGSATCGMPNVATGERGATGEPGASATGVVGLCAQARPDTDNASTALTSAEWIRRLMINSPKLYEGLARTYTPCRQK